MRAIQGKLPEFMYVVAPWTEFEPQVYRTGDYAAYYRLIMNWLEAAVTEDGQVANYPDPRQHCDICRWSRSCDARRRADDHLCLVAGISNLQRDELRGRSVETTAILASEPLPLTWRPNRGAVASYERVREQARVQVEGRSLGEPVYETLELEDGVGLAMLPEPSPGTVSSTSREIPSSDPADWSTYSVTWRRTIAASSNTRGCGGCHPQRKSGTSKSSWTG